MIVEQYDEENGRKEWQVFMFNSYDVYDDEGQFSVMYNKKIDPEIVAKEAQKLGYDCFEIIETITNIKRYAIED